MRKGKFKPIIILSIFTLVSLLLLWIKQNFEIVINNSLSINKKVLIVLRTKNVKVGDLIVFRFKGSEIAPKGLRFIKRVVCGPGDFLEVKNDEFFCNGKFLGKALEYTCKDHKKIDNFQFSGIIPKDKFFVMGETLCSYDSRYWGFVDKKSVEGKAILSFGKVESFSAP